MSEREPSEQYEQNESQGPSESEPNLTQQAIDQEGPSDQPADVGGWEANEPSAQQGEQDQSEQPA